MAKVTGLLLALVVATIVGANSPVIAKDDLVRHTIRCPGSVAYRINWQDKISSDPTLKVAEGSELANHTANLRYMSRNGQTIICFYAVIPSGASPGARYEYRVERTILNCTTPSKGPGNVTQMQCDLKP